MVKTVLLATTALAVLSTAAIAADLPSRRAPPVYIAPVPVFSWTGAYVGGQIGYEFGNDNATTNIFGVQLPTRFAKPTGVIGGAHLGYNFSTQGLPVFGGFLGAGGVFGLEGDVDGANYRKTYGLFGFNDTNSTPIQGSIRGRLGVAVDRVLFYATGGAAFADTKDAYFVGPLATLREKTRVGYTVGGGVEYAFLGNWSVRAEYRYTDFGTYTDAGIFGFPIAVRHRDTDNRVQMGFSYKFDTVVPVPVVARY